MAAIGDPAEVLKISNSTIHEARKNSIAYNYGIDPNARVNRKARRKLSGDTQRKRGRGEARDRRARWALFAASKKHDGVANHCPEAGT